MMQKNDHSKWSKLWKEKGYYILLTLCLVAAGASGIAFIGSVMGERQAAEESLSVPVAVEPELPDDPEAALRELQPEPPAEPAVEETPLAQPEPEELPVMPVSGIVLQDYAMDHLCYNATTRDWRVHNGVDLEAPLGENVLAARSGTVSAVYEDEYLGMTVVVQHDGGYTSHYCNLALEPAVKAGQTVTAGQVLGQVGDTALLELADAPHLHFEVYQDGTPADPAGFLY